LLSAGGGEWSETLRWEPKTDTSNLETRGSPGGEDQAALAQRGRAGLEKISPGS